MESMPYSQSPMQDMGYDPCLYDEYYSEFYSTYSSLYFYYFSTSNETTPHRIAESIVVPSIFGLITIVGLFGNFTIIFVTFRSRMMRGVTNFFIMNNAISDIIFLLLCVPITGAQFVLADWIYGTVVCKFFAYVQHVAVQASCATLVAMTLDRYKVILRPMESLTSRTVTRTTMTNLTIWIVSLLVHLPSLVFFRVNTMGTCLDVETIRFCGVEDLGNKYFVSYEIFSKFIMYIIPFIIMSYCYLRIVRSVWNKYQLASLSNAYNDTRRRQKVKVTQMTVLVVLLFGICWGPLHVIHLVGYLRGNEKRNLDQNRRFLTFCLCLAYSNAALNPFVYALTGRYYREILHQACRTKAFSKKRNSAIPPTSTTRAGVRRQSLDLPFDPRMLGSQRLYNENPDRRISGGIRDQQTSALVPAKRSRPSDESPLRILPEVDQDIVNQRAEILRRKYSLDDDFV